MNAKRQYVACYLDDPRPTRRYFPTSRSRVAYLLNAARSRGAVIHRIHTANGWNYAIGVLAINQRHAYHETRVSH